MNHLRGLVTGKLSKALGLNMVVVGLVMGFALFASYAVPLPEKAEAAGQAGYLTFQSTCTACHTVDTVQNYQGSSTWPEIIGLMKGYGAFMQEEEEAEILQYLEEAYPR
ncbi:MAG: cytochrome c [Desulfitobacterium hafniense]|nr:cytochrome c [Desulfitobacterium hafniense]MEA5024409.1 cytochrome c [Desulfitobacterium hafniense]